MYDFTFEKFMHILTKFSPNFKRAVSGNRKINPSGKLLVRILHIFKRRKTFIFRLKNALKGKLELVSEYCLKGEKIRVRAKKL